MTPSPIRKALSTMRKHQVRCLLMGGQACIFYGGAEFSRDTDLAVWCEPANLARMQAALDELQAECIVVPPFETRYLEFGLAVHFRCRHPDALHLRIDILSKMRGVDDFPELWDRRTTVESEDETIELLALPDLVKAKKTQRDKDWPMIVRLLEANYFQNREHPNQEQLRFWLAELRTPSLLVELAGRNPAAFETALPQRPLLSLALAGDALGLQAALKEEEDRERAADRAYWLPLRLELERLRAAARNDASRYNRGQ